MRELVYVRPSYEACGDPESASYPDAHRLTRMAISIGQILGAPSSLVDASEDAVTRVGNSSDDEARYTTDEVRTLAELVSTVATELRDAVDVDYHPRGEGGARIRHEATAPTTFDDGTPDYDRVFEIDADGRVGTVYPRLSMFELLEQLPTLAEFLRRAAGQRLEIALTE